MVAIMVAIEAVPDAKATVSVVDILLMVLAGTTISHPGCIFERPVALATSPFM